MCKNPHKSPILASFYFFMFAVISAMVLLTLFVGVVSTSMEEAGKKAEQKVSPCLHSSVAKRHDDVTALILFLLSTLPSTHLPFLSCASSEIWNYESTSTLPTTNSRAA